MPYNRLIRILFAVSWILLLLYVASLDNCDWEKNRIVSLILGLISWGATLFFAIKNAGAFDERSFHRTRPLGDRRAFQQHTRMIGWTLLLAFIAMLIRGWFYHLGWRASLIGAMTLTLLLMALGAALSTGFSLCLSGWHRKKLALCLLLYLPALCWVLIKGLNGPHNHLISGYMIFPWGYGISNGLFLCVIFTACAWFCAASLRRWKTSLALTVMAIFLLPCHIDHTHVVSAGHRYERPPTKSINLRFRKKIDDEDKKFTCAVSQFLRAEEPLQIGEFFTLGIQFSQNELLKRGLIESGHARSYSFDFPPSSFTVTSAYAPSPVIRTHNSTKSRPRTMILEDLFPEAAIETSSFTHQIQYSSFDPKHIDGFVSLINNAQWKCTGSRYLMQRVTSFRFDSGGVYHLEGGGLMRVSPHSQREDQLITRVNAVCLFERDVIEEKYTYFIDKLARDFLFILTNANESKAITMRSHSNNENIQYGAKSFVHETSVLLQDLKDWTAEDIRDAKIHVLQTKTLERIEFDQSHLILEE